jgi:hypothetical protein
MKKTTLVAVFAMFLIGLSPSAFASPVVGVGTATTVAGTANLWGAVSLTGAGDGSGTTPTEVTGITAGATYSILQIGTGNNVSCSTIYCAGGNAADGAQYSDLSTATQMTAPGNGISGISFSQDSMFLIGVFINSSALPSGSGPASLNYGTGGPTGTTSNATDVPTFQPGLNQTFFVGDGTEGFNGVCPASVVQGIACVNGQVQIFTAPAGANELFLGFADGGGEVGPPADYGDNGGSLNEIVNLATTPEPGTMMLMGLGLAACALLRKKLA